MAFDYKLFCQYNSNIHFDVENNERQRLYTIYVSFQQCIYIHRNFSISNILKGDWYMIYTISVIYLIYFCIGQYGIHINVYHSIYGGCVRFIFVVWLSVAYRKLFVMTNRELLWHFNGVKHSICSRPQQNFTSHLASSPNRFSWVCKFADVVSIVTNVK